MRCKSCGAELPFDSYGRMKCDYCGAQNYVPIPEKKIEVPEKRTNRKEVPKWAIIVIILAVAVVVAFYVPNPENIILKSTSPPQTTTLPTYTTISTPKPINVAPTTTPAPSTTPPTTTKPPLEESPQSTGNPLEKATKDTTRSMQDQIEEQQNKQRNAEAWIREFMEDCFGQCLRDLESLGVVENGIAVLKKPSGEITFVYYLHAPNNPSIRGGYFFEELDGKDIGSLEVIQAYGYKVYQYEKHCTFEWGSVIICG